MEFAPWNPDLMVGIDFVDSEHRHLFKLVNELHESMVAGKGKEATAKLLQALHSYTSSHFSREEAMLAQRGYPKLAEHKLLHSKFVEKLASLQMRFDSGAILINVELLKFLKSWLTEHIAAEDKIYAHFLKSGSAV